jgi:hypothetical protein
MTGVELRPHQLFILSSFILFVVASSLVCGTLGIPLGFVLLPLFWVTLANLLRLFRMQNSSFTRFRRFSLPKKVPFGHIQHLYLFNQLQINGLLIVFLPPSLGSLEIQVQHYFKSRRMSPKTKKEIETHLLLLLHDHPSYRLPILLGDIETKMTWLN